MAREKVDAASSAGESDQLPGPEAGAAAAQEKAQEPASAKEEAPAKGVRLIALLENQCVSVTHDGVAYDVGADGTITVPQEAVHHILPHGFTRLEEG